ncbi:MAG: hypothetical protein ACD_62C00255G0002 [uncultured bacterium]|nr:MAG: hypothetical protein ACD_62C00255G0002 [uncultured bacterium]
MSFFSFIKTPAPITPLTDQSVIDKTYKKHRLQNLYSMIIGYAAFYFVRKNFSIALPILLKETGFSKTDFGFILTAFSIVYGFGKFFNGVLADKLNARYFMAFGLLCSAVVNLFFGMSSGLTFFAIFWIANAWFQSMGMPPSVRLLTQWYSPTELGTKWALQSTAHQIGSAGIMLLCANYVIPHFGWRGAFFVPAIIAVVIALWLVERLRDNPRALGLPAVETHRGETHIYDSDTETSATFKEILFQHVLTNKYIWIVALANCFVYVARMGIVDWAPTFFTEARGNSLAGAGFKAASFEIAGVGGCLLAGWLSDTLFKGRRGPLAAVSMLILSAVFLGFVFLPVGHNLVETMLLMSAGILVYGPQLLVPVAAADFAGKKAAATATGMTGQAGYLGAALSGIGTGLIVDKWGWNGGMIFFSVCTLLGALLFMLIWNKRSVALEAHHNKTTIKHEGCCAGPKSNNT